MIHRIWQMTHRFAPPSAPVATALMLAQALSPCHAETFPLTYDSLHYGQNILDLDGDGQPEVVLRLQRENFNAHGYDVLLFHGGGHTHDLITVLDPETGQHRDQVTIRGGPDCRTQSWFLTPPDPVEGLELVEATRAPGQNALTPGLVTFRFYKLVRNKEGLPGDPARFWKLDRSHQSLKLWCDVEDAYSAEGLE